MRWPIESPLPVEVIQEMEGSLNLNLTRDLATTAEQKMEIVTNELTKLHKKYPNNAFDICHSDQPSPHQQKAFRGEIPFSLKTVHVTCKVPHYTRNDCIG
jgi:hypothetical protein